LHLTISFPLPQDSRNIDLLALHILPIVTNGAETKADLLHDDGSKPVCFQIDLRGLDARPLNKH